MKKGFTLIELLAVIVILAIVAVITVPKVSEMINTARKGGAEDSFYGVLKTAELAWSKGLKDNKNLGSAVCKVEEQMLKCSGKVGNATVEFDSNISGTAPENGEITLMEDGSSVVGANNSLLINGYKCFGNSSEVSCVRDGDLFDIKIGNQSVETVTSGSGLYISNQEIGRYIYRGSSPNNYIKLDNEMYRIISKEPDGTIKTIKNDVIGNLPFDPGYSNDISGVTSSNSTEGTRYSSNSSDFCYVNRASSYEGCKVWGSRATMLDSKGNHVTKMPWKIGDASLNLPEKEAYLNTYLNITWYNSLSENIKNVISTHSFNVGLVNKNEADINKTLETERAYKWVGNIGLLNVSDYVLVSTNVECGSIKNYVYKDYGGKKSCYETSNEHNWIYKDIVMKGDSPRAIGQLSGTSARGIYGIYANSGDITGSVTNEVATVVPVFYLKSSIKLTGEGTEKNPYIVVN